MAKLRTLLALLLALQPVSAFAAGEYGKSVPSVVLPVGPVGAQTGFPNLSLPGAIGSLPAGAVALPGAVVPGVSKLPSAAVAASVPGIPSLPTAAVGLPQAAASGAAAQGKDQPGAYAGLSALGEALHRAGLVSDSEASREAARRFDGQDSSGDVPDSSGKFVARSPKLPDGMVKASVHEVHTADDIDRYVPSGQNSDELIVKLKAELKRMAPYRVVTYFDAKGGRTTAIDISQNPKLIENFPEQHSHEIQLIKKIQLYTKDLQLVVREDGKTPDLVMNGVFTELKSLIGSHVDFSFLVNKANKQVLEHAARHGLGHGAAAIDMTAEKQVPVKQVVKDLEAWRKTQPEGEVFLKRVYVFAGLEMKVFQRGADGKYAEADPKSMPFTLYSPKKEATPKEIRALQLLLKKGRVGDAEKKLALIESAPAEEPNHPVNQIRRATAGERLLKLLAKLVASGDVAQAWAEWQGYRLAQPEQAAQLEPRLRELLPVVKAPKQTFVDHEAERYMKEIEEPGQALEQAGIDATVTVYGSARLKPGSPYYEEARKFGALVAKFGLGKIAVVTGGGPGIMEAANRGAFEAGGPSVGYNITLEHEQVPNPYVTKGLSYDFEYFFTRKMALRRGAMAMVYFPGGFGTLDELFEVLTLMQTGKMARAPIVLVGEKQHWAELLDFQHLGKQGLISPKDLSLFRFAETAEEAWKLVAAGVK